MPLQCRYTMDIIWHILMAAKRFIVQKRGDLKLRGPKKVLFHVTKTWHYLENAFNS